MKAFIRLTSLVLMAGVLLSFCGCDKSMVETQRKHRDSVKHEHEDDEDETETSKEYTFLEKIESMTPVVSSKNCVIYDADFNNHIIEARWWDYDKTMESPGVYSANGTRTLAFSIQVDQSLEYEKVYFAYYYSNDRNFDSDDLGKPIYKCSTTPMKYDNGTYYYDVEYESKSQQKGYYVVVVASDNSFNKPYVVAYCEVR